MPNKKMQFGVDILPDSDSTYDLGSDNKKFNNVFVNSINGNIVISKNAEAGFGIGVCDTVEETVSKIATMSDYSPKIGGIVSIRFTYAVPAASTLEINGKGAKAIYYQNSAITANKIKSGDTATFMYDGTAYHLLSVDSASSHVVTWGDLYST